MSNLNIDTDRTKKILTDFIHGYVTGAGFSKAVIGLSGGVDSSLACYLTVAALGAENVLGLRMPYKTSSPSSLEHAQLVIDDTGIQSLTFPISALADTLIDTIPASEKVRRGNVMARCRMMVLYDQSAAFGGLVIGTGNKTEILMGYSTQFGDAACALNPVGDLYKTQVRQLARAIGVPDVIIEKPPSADLWQGQTDEGELGFTYEEMDKLLYQLVDAGKTPQQCIKEGFHEKFVTDVVARMEKYQYKSMMPPIGKIS